MIRDPEHANESHEDGAPYPDASERWNVAYAEWHGPDVDLPALIAADDTVPLIAF
jgi:hypothetical protein